LVRTTQRLPVGIKSYSPPLNFRPLDPPAISSFLFSPFLLWLLSLKFRVFDFACTVLWMGSWGDRHHQFIHNLGACGTIFSVEVVVPTGLTAHCTGRTGDRCGWVAKAIGAPVTSATLDPQRYQDFALRLTA
jgi:hypothetical protein